MPGQSFKYGLPSHFQGNWQNGNREGANVNKAANNNKAPPKKIMILTNLAYVLCYIIFMEAYFKLKLT